MGKFKKSICKQKNKSAEMHFYFFLGCEPELKEIWVAYF